MTFNPDRVRGSVNAKASLPPAPMTTVQTAAQRRTILANAHAAWHATRMNPAIDAVHNLKQAFVQTDMIASHDFIADIRLDGTSIQILVDCDDWREVLELDAYGNVTKGQGGDNFQ